MSALSPAGVYGRIAALPRSLPVPRSYAEIKVHDVWAMIIGVGILLGAMWFRHGGLARDPLLAAGEVTALFGTYAALVGILFAARAPWLDQVMGTDGLRTAHRWLGFISVWAIAAHAVLSTLAYAGGSITAFVPTLISLVQTVPGILGAVVGIGLFGFVAVASMKAARRRVSYETWHGIHLYVYLAVAFAFLHQLTIGADFVTDPLATWLWIALYAAAFGPLLVHRVIWPIVITVRHQPRVERIERATADTFNLYVSGRDLDRLAVRSGQFFVLRAMTRADWMHGHPFSISAAPDGRSIRFTIKLEGKGTRALAALRPGTRLLLEGPYGAMHDARAKRRRLLLIGAGIGIAPIRAMAEGFRFAPGDADLIFRARSTAEAPLLDELHAIARQRGIRLHLLFGNRGSAGVPADPLSPAEITRLVPDVAARDVYLCGPNALMERVRSSLRDLGTAPSQIHYELFG